MFLELFIQDLNRPSWTEYEIHDEINHVRQIHLCKPVLGHSSPVDQGSRKQVNVETNLCFPDCSSVRNSIPVFVPVSLLNTK